MARWEERHWQVKTLDLAAQFASLRYGGKEPVEARSLSLSKCPRFALGTVPFDLRQALRQAQGGSSGSGSGCACGGTFRKIATAQESPGIS